MQNTSAYKIECLHNKLKCFIGVCITSAEIIKAAALINKNIPIGSLVKISNLYSNRPAGEPIIFFNAYYSDNYIEINCYYKKRQSLYLRNFEIIKLQ